MKQRARGDPGRVSGLGSVSQTIHHRDENAFREMRHEVEVAGFDFSRECARAHRPLDRACQGAIFSFRNHAFHFRIVTVVPSAAVETISKSSINLLAPGSPSPRLFPVE